MVPSETEIFDFQKLVWQTSKVQMNNVYGKSRDENLWYFPDHKQISNVELDISISTKLIIS